MILFEAVDTLITLGWALLAWLTVFAAVAAVVLLAGTAVGMWAVRGASRALRGRLPASKPLRAVPEPHGTHEASDAHTATRPRPAPSWAHTDRKDAA